MRMFSLAIRLFLVFMVLVFVLMFLLVLLFLLALQEFDLIPLNIVYK